MKDESKKIIVGIESGIKLMNNVEKVKGSVVSFVNANGDWLFEVCHQNGSCIEVRTNEQIVIHPRTSNSVLVFQEKF